MARHVGHLKLRLKPAQLYVRLSIIPLSQQANHVSSGIVMHYVVAFVCLHFCLTGYQSAQFIRKALHYASGSRKFLHQSAQPTCGRSTKRLVFFEFIYLDSCLGYDPKLHLVVRLQFQNSEEYGVIPFLPSLPVSL